MPTSSIADEITRLSGCRNDILSAISAKGVTVPVGSVLSSCPSLIASIPTGGGGSPTSILNTGFSATGSASYTRPFTATQRQVPVYDSVTSSLSLSTAGSQYVAYLIKYNNSSFFTLDGSTPNSLKIWGLKATWQTFPTGGEVYLSNTDAYQGGSSVGRWSAVNTTTTDFTAEANFTATSTQQTEYLVFFDINTWSTTAQQTGEGTTYTQTGTDVPYPGYPLTASGYMTSTASGKEYWSVQYVYPQGDSYVANIEAGAIRSAYYYAGTGPSTGSSTSVSEAYSGVPTGNTLRNQIVWYMGTGIEDTGYTYSYGQSASGYTGYVGP